MGTWSRFLKPAEILDALQVGFRAYRGKRILALGISGVGKTTFWQHVRDGAPPPVDLDRTANIEDLGRFAAHDIKLAGMMKVRMRGFDVPGHLEEEWPRAIELADPHAILFACDHAAGYRDRTPDPKRLAEHDAALRHVLDALLQIEPPSLERIAVVVNKSDLWRPEHSRIGLLEDSGIQRTLQLVRTTVPDVSIKTFETSALHGDNLRTVVHHFAGA